MNVGIVLVEHLNKYNGSYGSAGYYTFQVPENQRVKCGQYVIVDTAKGPNQVAQCICDSFMVDTEVMGQALGVNPKKLKPVKAVLESHELVWEHESEKLILEQKQKSEEPFE